MVEKQVDAARPATLLHDTKPPEPVLDRCWGGWEPESDQSIRGRGALAFLPAAEFAPACLKLTIGEPL